MWQSRCEKRQGALVMVKASEEYQHLEECRRNPCRRAATATAPHSPDPLDRNISKRRWEGDIRAWRAALRSWSAAERRAFPWEAV